MGNSKKAAAPAAPPTTSTPQVVEEVVNKEAHALFKEAVGKLQWQVRMPQARHCLHRQGIGLIVEWADRGGLQTAQAPLAVHRGVSALQAVGRVRSGAIFDHMWTRHGQVALRRERGPREQCCFSLIARPTSCPRQSVFAVSFTASYLYAIGTGRREALLARSCLMDTKLLDKLHIVLGTDSPSAKNRIATTFGATERTRQLQLRDSYLQQLLQRGIMKLRNVHGGQNRPTASRSSS